MFALGEALFLVVSVAFLFSMGFYLYGVDEGAVTSRDSRLQTKRKSFGCGSLSTRWCTWRLCISCIGCGVKMGPKTRLNGCSDQLRFWLWFGSERWCSGFNGLLTGRQTRQERGTMPNKCVQQPPAPAMHGVPWPTGAPDALRTLAGWRKASKTTR